MFDRRLITLLIGTAAVVPATTAAATSPPSGELTVFAAASLTDVFGELGDAYAAEYPDVDVVFSFAASSTLAGQVIDGAPADVFASADVANMDRVIAEWPGEGSPASEVFAGNELTLAVEADNPLGIESVTDVADHPEWIFVTCAPDVPIGGYTASMFANAGLEFGADVEVDSYEANVRDVLGKVELGEADAGVVYATDVGDDIDVDAVEIPDEWNVTAEYPIVAVTDTGTPFVEFVLSPAGQDILAAHGFVTASDLEPASSQPSARTVTSERRFPSSHVTDRSAARR